MKHIQLVFSITDLSVIDIVIAELAEIGFDGFEETDDRLIAYIGADLYDQSLVQEIASRYELNFQQTEVAAQNWNAQWESNFQPVIIEGFCMIKAHFHDIEVTTPHLIRITPKMSFGTGHHATTQLMMLEMQKTVFVNKKVLDFGTGTGILAILAEQLGAASVLAIDNDEWSYENARENVLQNNCSEIEVVQSTLTDDDVVYDIILANINRHILLENMMLLYKHTIPGGTIIMSGLMHADEHIIVTEALNKGYHHVASQKLGDWLLLVFSKL